MLNIISVFPINIIILHLHKVMFNSPFNQHKGRGKQLNPERTEQGNL